MYLQLIKPGIIRGNLVSAWAGFFVGSAIFQPKLLISMSVGLALIIASACVINNIIDRSIDALMERTKQRALVTGRIPLSHAWMFAVVLALMGSLLLLLTTSLLTLLLSLTGMVLYIVVYGYAKRTTSASTLVGSLSGALPPIVGYVAAGNGLDFISLLLLLILISWQMVHFYGIALFRKSEYASASVPLLPIVRGVKRTKISMILYSIMFLLSTVSLGMVANLGIFYSVTLSLVSIYWTALAIKNRNLDAIPYGKLMFRSSLGVLLLWSICIILSRTFIDFLS